MKLNPNDYLIQKPYIKTWLESRPNFNYAQEVGMMTLATGTPIIIVSYFIGQLLGFTPEIHDKISRDMAFYHIEELTGYPITQPPSEPHQ